MTRILAERVAVSALIVLVFMFGMIACNEKDNSGNTNDGDVVDGDSAADGDLGDNDGDAELADDDFVPHQPVVCPVNDCQSRRISEGFFCFGYDLAVDGDSDGPLLDQVEGFLRTLVECGTDENDCPVEISRSECEYGCDPEQHICNDPPARSELSLTISRTQTPTSVVENGSEATDFDGALSIMIYAEARQSGQAPTADLLAHALIPNVDLSEAETEITYTVPILLASSPTGMLAAGTYYLDAILKINEAGTDGPLVTGDLLHTDPVVMTVPDEGPCTATVVLDRVYDESFQTR